MTPGGTTALYNKPSQQEYRYALRRIDLRDLPRRNKRLLTPMDDIIDRVSSAPAIPRSWRCTKPIFFYLISPGYAMRAVSLDFPFFFTYW